MASIYFRHDKVREGQKQLINDIVKAIEQKKNLIAHASTGIGKTDASISAVLKYALDNEKTVFFCTPKTSQHKIAVQVIQELAEKYKLDLKAIDLVGKKHMCADNEIREKDAEDFYELCKKRRTKGKCPYYENIHGDSFVKRMASKRRLDEVNEWHGAIKEHSELTTYCQNFEERGYPYPLCGYETTIKIGKKANIVICDYFQILNPHIADTLLQRIEKELDEAIVIIDEAHNCPDRMRRGLSVSLDKKTVQKAIQECLLTENKILAKKLEKIIEEIELAERKLDVEERVFYREEIPFLKKDELNDLYQTGLLFLESTTRSRSNCLRVLHFYEQWMVDSESHLRLIRRRNGKIRIHHLCLDPSIVTGERFEQCHSVILMSGTLKPGEMYRDLLGLNKKNTEIKEYPSPFPKENKLNIITKDITTKYEKRNETEFKKIAKRIEQIVDNIPGNTAIFFPSYKFLDLVVPFIEFDKPIIKQEPGISPEQINNLLEKFRKKSKQGAVLLGVTGGSFAEGIDFPGNDLLGVIVVGIPLKEPNLETNALIRYYDLKFGKGWDYGYTFPAMSKAVQAAGRVIRDEKDKGVIVFMDDRFSWSKYGKCFPNDFNFTVLKSSPAKIVKDFWKN